MFYVILINSIYLYTQLSEFILGDDCSNDFCSYVAASHLILNNQIVHFLHENDENIYTFKVGSISYWFLQ